MPTPSAPEYATYPSLRDESVFVTGGADGIGRALVRAFAGQGARVGFCDINVEKAQEAVALCEEAAVHHSPLFYEVDLVDIDALRRAIRVVESAVQAATYMVFGLAQHAPEQQGMGTTVSVLAMCGDYGITAQVGDSRIYLVRGHAATSLTEDHTLVAWQLKQGIITEAEAARSPHRNVITRAVGSREYVQVDTGFLEVQPSDAFLLCSDGLHGYLQENEIPEVIDMGPRGAAERFVHMANSRGGRDNITAVVVNVR